ncbi:glycosyltransferase [Mesorhizobium sp. AR10]|uniref:glycosyltransferase n=1 Tax=Mesorhizobium sp. AR10 TaxID=2865839 RepID=UPI00215F4C06|nr:glycosyltransferase [Mesorhizobium sp. AR10]UVK37826.1 glycosyltransferase [Mesorhizobium sp. AR10]
MVRESYSIVVEMENAGTIDWHEVGVGIAALAREIKAATDLGYAAKPQVIFVHPGEVGETPLLQGEITARVPELGMAATVVFAALPDGRYYELKNRGIAEATGDIVIFNDSDTVAEPGWLPALLQPFRDARTVAVNGHTYLGHDDFASRTFALLWIFPLRDQDRRFAAKRAMNANNCALRRSWLASHPFPQNNGFKVSCTLLNQQLRAEGHDMVRVEALASHYPPRGLRFFVWRALVTGRDADRKYAALTSISRPARMAKALRRLASESWRVSLRIAVHAPGTGMPVWQVPLAMAAGLAFNSLVFVGQFGLAAGLTRDDVERIPAFVGHS